MRNFLSRLPDLRGHSSVTPKFGIGNRNQGPISIAVSEPILLSVLVLDLNENSGFGRTLGHSIPTWMIRGGEGSVESPRLVIWQNVGIIMLGVKCTNFVNSRGVQYLVTFGPVSCWMTPNSFVYTYIFGTKICRLQGSLNEFMICWMRYIYSMIFIYLGLLY